MLFSFWLAFWLLSTALARAGQSPGNIAPKPETASEAYDYVQQRREEAADLWRRKDPQGIRILEDALHYLQSPTVLDFANGNLYLHTRSADVCYDLACAHALLGHKAEALHALQAVVDAGGYSGLIEVIGQEPAFAAWRQEAEYQEVLHRLAAHKRLWSGPAAHTPYRPNLTTDEKIAGLSEFWSQVKYNFVHFDKVPDLDWNAQYLAYLPRVMHTRSTAEYYRVLQEMCVSLHDAHTNVYPPSPVTDALFVRPPLRTGLVEGKVLILEVLSEELTLLGLQVGQEILNIDGIPIRQYAQKYVVPFQSSSTPQDMEVRAYTYALLRGVAKHPIHLTLQDAGGNVFDKTVPRTGYKSVQPLKRLETRILPGNIGYVALNAFGDEAIDKDFEEIYPTLVKTNALILDVRRNGGGDTSIGLKILGYLTDKPIPISRQQSRSDVPLYRARGAEMMWREEQAASFPPNGQRLYAKPVVVLASAATFSAAEDFCVSYVAMKRGKLVGEPTGGSTGQPLSFSLPGGGSARVCAKHDSFPDGTEFIGIGIQPDILIHPSVSDVRAHRDTVLEAAMAYLQSSLR